MGRPIKLTGWRFAAFVGCLVGSLGLCVYPVIISPMIDPTPYKRMQRYTRSGVDQEKIQPGNMKVWSDPFERKTEK